MPVIRNPESTKNRSTPIHISLTPKAWCRKTAVTAKARTPSSSTILSCLSLINRSLNHTPRAYRNTRPCDRSRRLVDHRPSEEVRVLADGRANQRAEQTQKNRREVPVLVALCRGIDAGADSCARTEPNRRTGQRRDALPRQLHRANIRASKLLPRPNGKEQDRAHLRALERIGVHRLHQAD